MLQFPVEPQEVIDILQAEFPKEFTIIMQRLHIQKLQEYIQLHDLDKEVESLVDNG